MIPGDIDLTEKLDFRKTVKKQLPQLPQSWGKNRLNVDNSDISFSIANNDYTITTTDNLLTWSYINNRNIRSRTTTTSINRTDDWIINIEPSNNTLSFSDSWIDDQLISAYYYDDGFTTISFSRTSTYHSDDNFTSFSTKKNGIFKSIIEDPIEAIPWGKKYKQNIRSIPWGKKYNSKSLYYYYDDEDRIPWEIPLKTLRDNRIAKRFYDRYDRAHHLIAWFFDKTRERIRRHLVDDDDLSYLTNMSWIRVRNAEID